MLVMPQPARTSHPAIIATARALLEQDGPPGLTMRALARALHVSAPSLYFHVESRDDLLSQLIAAGLTDFGRAMREAASAAGSVRARARRLCRAYIDFASGSPQLFTLVFGPCVTEDRYDHQAAEAAALPVLELAAEVVGPERAMFLAEALWSLVHGYVVLRLAEQFRMNPEHEAGLEYAVDILLEGAKLAVPGAAR
jgi:AcrR family transcriptional regulator